MTDNERKIFEAGLRTRKLAALAQHAAKFKPDLRPMAMENVAMDLAVDDNGQPVDVAGAVARFLKAHPVAAATAPDAGAASTPGTGAPARTQGTSPTSLQEHIRAALAKTETPNE